MPFDFDEPVERRGTWSTRWERYPGDVIPLWVADTDLRGDLIRRGTRQSRLPLHPSARGRAAWEIDAGGAGVSVHPVGASEEGLAGRLHREAHRNLTASPASSRTPSDDGRLPARDEDSPRHRPHSERLGSVRNVAFQLLLHDDRVVTDDLRRRAHERRVVGDQNRLRAGDGGAGSDIVQGAGGDIGVDERDRAAADPPGELPPFDRGHRASRGVDLRDRLAGGDELRVRADDGVFIDERNLDAGRPAAGDEEEDVVVALEDQRLATGHGGRWLGPDGDEASLAIGAEREAWRFDAEHLGGAEEGVGEQHA